MAGNIIKPVIEEKVNSLVETSKEEKTVGPGNHSVKLDVENTNKLLKQVQEEVSNNVTKKIVEGFMQRLPERFTSGNSRSKQSYVRPSNVTIYGQNGGKINIAGSIKYNMLEAFEQTSQELNTKESSPEVKAVVDLVSEADIKQDNIVSAKTDVVNKNNGTKNVNIEVCTTCKTEDSKVLTNSVASIVASKLLDNNVNSVEVTSEPGKKEGTAVLKVSANVPIGESGNRVANTMIKSVNDASVVINSKNGGSKNKSNDFVNFVLIGLIGFMAYKYYKNSH
jgi:hypothetical protein